MKITSLEPWKGTFYKVFVDGEYFAVLDAETLVGEHLHTGVEVDVQRLQEVRYASELRRARERALHLLEYRSHTRQELLDKLLRNYEREICEDVVQRLEEIGLINDEDYARRAAATMLGAKHYGEMRVRQELLRRGIERELVETVLEELDWDPHQELYELVQAKYLRLCVDEKGIRRATNALLRLGYSYSQVRDVLRELMEEDSWQGVE